MKYKFGEPYTIDGDIKIYDDHHLDIECFGAAFTGTVSITSSTINSTRFTSTWFHRGFQMSTCKIRGKSFFDCGIHNNKPFIIKNCQFLDFVDFADSNFEAPITIENTEFVKGTNLLGEKGTPIEVDFEFEPKLINVYGRLDITTFKKPIRRDIQ